MTYCASILQSAYNDNYDWFYNHPEIIVLSLDQTFRESYYSIWFRNEEVFVECILKFSEHLRFKGEK